MVGRVGTWVWPSCVLLAACSFDATGVWSYDSGPALDGPATTDSRPPSDGPSPVDAPVGVSDADTTPDADTAPDADTTPDADTAPDADSGGLIDDGLVVRYYLDEAASGQDPTRVEDAAPSPLPLGLTYTPEMTFTEIDGHRGLSWSATGVDARASVAVDSTKIHSALDGSKTATIELVIEVDGVTSSVSRISHIGAAQQAGRFTLASSNSSVLRFHFADELAASWNVSMPSIGRIVVHLVFDSTQADEADRARLYVDGALVDANGDGTAPGLDATITLGTGRHYVLGNREVGGRSYRGEMFYAAMYAAALPAADVAHNAEILSTDDDSP